MIQTQFAHTVTVPDEWEHNGHTFQVFHDIDADWDTKFCFSSEELGVSKGEYDYVTRGGDLRIREDFEVMAAEAVDDLHKPITVLGRTLKASDIAREMLSDDWEAYVNSCIANLIAMDEIKEVC
jgi:hypothetical protein